MQIRTISRLVFLVLALILVSPPAFAQISNLFPATDTRFKSCDEYATNVLHDPWDMNAPEDISNFTNTDVQYIATTSFSNGWWNFQTTAPSAATFFLLSPHIAYPVGGRYGIDHPIDTSKYRSLVMRFSTDKDDPGGMKLLWNRSNSYVASRTVTGFLPIKKGWQVTRTDLVNDVSISAPESSNLNPWSAGNILGFGIQATQVAGATMKFDYIRLEDPSSCPSANFSYTANASGNDGLFNLYLDDNRDPSDGYHAKLLNAQVASGAGSFNNALSGLAPGGYQVVGLLHSDFALLERNDAWDMNESSDVAVDPSLTSISNPTFASGVFSGVASSAEPSIYLSVPSVGINASKYSKLSFKLTRSASDSFSIFWNSSVSGFTGMVIVPATHDSDHDRVYTVDLSGQPGWNGTISQLILRPTLTPGSTFNLDFVSLRAAGFVTTLSAPSYVSSAGNININDAPVIVMKEPNLKGGESFRAGNMATTADLQLHSNLRGDSDPGHSGETYTTFLPDVRSVEGVRGDFFKGTNIAGNEDPSDFVTWPLVANPVSFDASVYKNFCVKQLIDHDFDLCLGSIARPVWLRSDNASFSVSEGFVAIYNRWSTSRWYEYCVDLSKLPMQTAADATRPWGGTIVGMRYDPHEFHRDTCGGDGSPTGAPLSVSYYYDQMKINKDDTSHGIFNLVYDLRDADDNAQVTFYRNTSASTSGGTLIGTANKTNAHYSWDTTLVPNGTYYIYGVANDGYNSSSALATGPLVIANDVGSSGQLPILSLEAPSSSTPVCDAMQVKGYALEPDRIEAISNIEVLVDGNLFTTLEVNAYSPAAKVVYPNLDSSNAGFNQLISLAGVGNGSHTITIKAISSDGGVSSQDVTVTKQASGCADPIIDPDPVGVPIAVDVGPVAPPPVTASIPTIKSAKFSAKGDFSAVVNAVKEANVSCNLSLQIGKTKTAANTVINDYSAAKSSLTFKTSKVAIDIKKLKTVYIRANKSCSGFPVLQSAVKKVSIPKRFTSGKKASSIKNLAKALRAKMKVS